MKKMRQGAERLLVLVLIAGSVSTTGCSWLNPFVIVNESDSSITVEYQFAIIPATAGWPQPRRAFERPVLLNTADASDWNAPEQEMPADRVTADETRGQVRAVLAAGEALRVRKVHNYSVGEHWDQEVLLESVEITAPTGSVRYTGTQLQQRFVRDGQVYILRFS